MKLKKILSLLIAVVMLFSLGVTAMAEGTAVAKIGETTYTDLHTAMTSAKSGETVELVSDVDLAGTEWEPVSFKGKFNGKGFKIKNLTINKPGVSSTGFITSLNSTFENVTFENPTVTGGENTGVLAGRAGGSAAYAKDITVTGTIKVETTHTGYARAAAIVGGWAYGKYENITVDGIDKATSYIKHTGGGDGRYVAGIVGHADGVDAYINCTVKNITILGGWLCGGIAGPGPSDGIATGCAVENIDMGADYSGGMFGWYYGSGTIENSSVKNVTFTAGNINNGAIGGYQNNDAATVTNVIVENVKNKDGAPLLSDVAKIGETTYTTLQDAINAAKTGETVTLINNITLTEADLAAGVNKNVLIYVENKDITLDMNGQKISVVHEDSFSNDYIVAVIAVADGAGLTVTGNGTIDVKVLKQDSDIAYMFWKRGTTGHLTIENGTYHMNDSADSMVYTNGNEIVTVKGGTWTLDTYGTRENRAPWIFNVQGAGDNHVIVTGGTFNADINRQHWSNEVLVPETHYTVKNADNTYTVHEGAVAYVNEGMLTGGFFAPKNVGYATLGEAIAAAVERNDNPVVLIAETTESITIADNATVVIDLNDKTLNGYIAPCNPASLTVKNGSIVNTNGGYSAIEINSGKLTLENVNVASARHGVRIDGAVEAVIDGGEYKLTSLTGTRHAVNVSGAAKVTIKSGKFVGPAGTTMDSGSAVCVQAGADVTIEGGNFSGGKNATLGVSGTMAITGGTFDQDPTAYVADGYFAYNETGAYVVEEEPTMDTEASFVRNIKTTNSAGEERYQVILFAGVDSLKYDSVGFEIIVNGETRTQTTKKVYTSYTAAGIKYTPKAWGENCNYIVSLPINFKPEMKNDSVTFRPFAVTLNGETLWGPEKTIDKVYNK